MNRSPAENAVALARRMEAARRLASVTWPHGAADVLARLREGGHRAVIVGGSVRDALLGRTAHAALDVATDVPPDHVMARFPRVEPVGLAHGSVLILHDDLRVECTTFRREGAYADARRPDSVSFTGDLIEDLARRDLTVNAMAFDPSSGEFSDPFGGLEDLQARQLRAVGDPLARFHEDALRPLRVARFAATLEMSVETATRAALGSARDRSGQLAVERVRVEFERMLEARWPSQGFRLLHEARLLEMWMPELTAGDGVTQNRHHEHDVLEHSLRTLDAAPASKPVVRWAALLHDIGKPGTRAGEGGDTTFYGHAEAGSLLADALLQRLRFANETRERIVHLVRQHMFEYRPEWTDAALRRWLRRVGLDAVADLFDLRIADVLANPRHPGMPAHLEEMRERIERLLSARTAMETSDLAVDGHDVMRVLGLGPGPEVRRTLDEALEEITERPEHNEREWLLAWLAERDAARRSVPRKA
jgi:tRNA nucleotidyltransferase (CCA-adding enzyme)